MKEILQTVARIEAFFREFRNPSWRRRRDSDTTQEAPSARKGLLQSTLESRDPSMTGWAGGDGGGAVAVVAAACGAQEDAVLVPGPPDKWFRLVLGILNMGKMKQNKK